MTTATVNPADDLVGVKDTPAGRAFQREMEALLQQLERDAGKRLGLSFNEDGVIDLRQTALIDTLLPSMSVQLKPWATPRRGDPAKVQAAQRIVAQRLLDPKPVASSEETWTAVLDRCAQDFGKRKGLQRYLTAIEEGRKRKRRPPIWLYHRPRVHRLRLGLWFHDDGTVCLGNPCRQPAGTPVGGQYAPKDQGVCGTSNAVTATVGGLVSARVAKARADGFEDDDIHDELWEDDALRKDIHAALQEAVAGKTVAVQVKGTHNLQGAQKDVEAAVEFVASVNGSGTQVATSVGMLNTLASGPEAVGEYRAKVNSIILKRGASEPGATMAHELGHALEIARPEIAESARAFLFAKAQRDPAAFKQGTGLASTYATRVYAAGDTELLSTGLEQLFVNPGGFAYRAPDHFAWTLKQLGME